MSLSGRKEAGKGVSEGGRKQGSEKGAQVAEGWWKGVNA